MSHTNAAATEATIAADTASTTAAVFAAVRDDDSAVTARHESFEWSGNRHPHADRVGLWIGDRA